MIHRIAAQLYGNGNNFTELFDFHRFMLAMSDGHELYCSL